MMFFKSTFRCFLFLCTLSLFASCAQSAPVVSPLVRIGQTSVAPVIDGKLNDTVWKSSIAAANFSITGTNTPADESTQVRFLYDDQNLYVSWRCVESLLTIRLQLMDKVKADAKKSDSDVFSDDCVVLFIQPKQDGTSYEFDLNSIGTLFDAKSTADSLWKPRDASWDSGASSAAVREDGFWTAELAIPWTAFGMNAPPKIDANWPIALERRAVERKEASAWNQSPSPLMHSISNWGQLVFDNAVPGLTPQPIADFEAGKSIFTVQVSQPVEITVDLTEDQKTRHIASQGNGKINVPLSGQSAKVLFEWSAKVGQKYFYRSPQLALNAQGSSAHLKFSTSKAWRLYINGEQIKAGSSAKNRDVTFPLIKGSNDIVLQAESGQARLQLIPPGNVSQQKVVWRIHDASDAKVLSGIDRAAWDIAPQTDDVTGKAGTPVFLQHTLLYKSTLIYPVTTPAFYIAQGTAQQITFLVDGVKGIPLHDWSMSLAVPPEFEVLGSSGFYGNIAKDKAKFTTSKVGVTKIGGKLMSLYRVSADQPMLDTGSRNPVLQYFQMVVRLPETVKFENGKEWNFYYGAQGNQGAVNEALQTLSVRALPPLNGKQPKEFGWELWGTPVRLVNFDNQALLPSILDTSRQAGFNKYDAAHDKALNDLVRSNGMTPIANITFKDKRTINFVEPYLAQHPEDKLVDKDGRPRSTFMCTTQVLGKNWPMYAKSIQDVVHQSDAGIVEYDYEIPPFNRIHACFCERCLAAFREFSKIDAGVKLTPALVQADHREQWIDFMAYRTATLLKKIKEAVHAADPKVLFTVYSGYYNAKNNTTMKRYGIDWNLIGKMQAVDEAGMGYGRSVQSIKDSIEALRGIPVTFGILVRPSGEYSRQPVAPLRRSTLLRRALDATGGVLIYKRNSLDGRSWRAISDVTRLTADYEDVFLHKTLQDIPGQDPASVQIVKGAGKTLLCVMSFSPKESPFTFNIPEGLGEGKEYYSGQTVEAGQKVQVQLAPGDVRVYVFGE